MADKLINLTLKLNDKVTKPLRNAQKSIDGFIDSKFGWTKTVSKSFGALNKASGAPKLGKSISDLTTKLSGVGKEATALGATLFAGAAAGVGGMIALAKSTENFAGHLVDNVKRIGFNVEAYQELQYAAKKSGVSTEDFDKSMQKMTRSLGEAKAGQGALYSFLKKTNPQLLKQVLSAKDNETAFQHLTGALGSLKDSTKQAAFANIVFGKSGANFTNLANAGANGIREMRDEARELGILTEEQVTGADKLGDTFDALEQIFLSVKNTIGVALIPIVKQLGEQFITFYKENREKFNQFLVSFKENLPAIMENLKGILLGVVGAVTVLVNSFNFLSSIFGPTATIVGILAATIGKGLIVALWGASKAFLGLGITIMTTPIGWIIAGIAGIVAIIALLWNNWDGIVSFFKSSAQLIGDVLSKVFGTVSEKFSKIKNLLPSWLGGGASNSVDVTHKQIASNTVRNIHETQSSKNESEIKVSFDNMPRGSRVESKGSPNVETDISMGLMATSTL